ncbi:hypothetical protein ZHAS_00003547 [Anopheles sinensis]|uniref:Uncharacterized protein n=1 Tax=Anopheles sinensis TaxID=74873 RepID=A0A084VEJ0_ANOSI|nr:hypothetical protein ZHAS_00003547 [Anopheles sinensis]
MDSTGHKYRTVMSSRELIATLHRHRHHHHHQQQQLGGVCRVGSIFTTFLETQNGTMVDGYKLVLHVPCCRKEDVSGIVGACVCVYVSGVDNGAQVIPARSSAPSSPRVC